MESGAHHSGHPQGVNDPGPASGAWKEALRRAIRDPGELARRLGLDAATLASAEQGRQLFPLLVTESFLQRMRPGDAADPLLLQVLPQGREAEVVPGFGGDPVGEQICGIAPGLLQKYQGRALLVVTSACAVHCRYCFRRHYPYGAVVRSRAWWQEPLDRIAADPSIEELILSGGDPLCLDDDVLADLAAAAAAIPHLRRLRLHTRLPVVLPERIDARFCAWVAASRLSVVVVLHANHAAEIDDSVIAACRRLQAARALLLNQAVLLRGVNDAVDALTDLSQALSAAGVLPYYLHLLDRVAGAAHFEVAEDRARALVAELAARLPGYLVPRLVREEAGAPGKTVIPPAETAVLTPGRPA